MARGARSRSRRTFDSRFGDVPTDRIVIGETPVAPCREAVRDLYNASVAPGYSTYLAAIDALLGVVPPGDTHKFTLPRVTCKSLRSRRVLSAHLLAESGARTAMKATPCGRRATPQSKCGHL